MTGEALRGARARTPWRTEVRLPAVASATHSREKSIHKYLHLVKYVAGRISAALPSNVEIDDLINDGVVGLIDAIEKYDERYAVKFETYAIMRINGAILDALRSLDWAPRTVRRRARELERAHEALEAELGRAPTDDELAGRLGTSLRDLDRLRQHVRGASVGSLDEAHSCDALADEDGDVAAGIERDEARAELVAAVESLPPHERTVIRRYYFNGETLRAIKAELDVSESRVSQIHAQAVIHLRQRLRATAE
jgi:RNA polymerase sigma factor FliA